jgi:hypothetical protein
MFGEKLCKTDFGSLIRVIELVDSTVYIAKNVRELVMSVNGHYICCEHPVRSATIGWNSNA